MLKTSLEFTGEKQNGEDVYKCLFLGYLPREVALNVATSFLTAVKYEVERWEREQDGKLLLDEYRKQ